MFAVTFIASAAATVATTISATVAAAVAAIVAITLAVTVVATVTATFIATVVTNVDGEYPQSFISECLIFNELIVTIWILTLVVNTPVLTRYSTVVDKVTAISYCAISSKLAARQLYATFFAFAYLLPLSVIVVCSVSILRHIIR